MEHIIFIVDMACMTEFGLLTNTFLNQLKIVFNHSIYSYKIVSNIIYLLL